MLLKLVKIYIPKMYRFLKYRFSIDFEKPLFHHNNPSVDFNDVTSSQKTNSYQHFGKPNNDPNNIDIDSNHPLQVLNELSEQQKVI